MTSTLHTSASVDQAALLTFEQEFHSMVQQKLSRFGSSAAVEFVPGLGKTYNKSRIGRQSLVEVDTTNPEKQYADFLADNRQFTKKRFTRTIALDRKTDINELISDPTSDLMMELMHAINRVQDKIIAEAAAGGVLIGAPDQAPSLVSAADDGVLTIDETSGAIDFDTLNSLTENFINNEWTLEELRGAVFALTGKEHSTLMADTKVTSNDFVNGRPIDEGTVTRTGLYEFLPFAGSVTGGIQVATPVLPEITNGTVRENLVLAPGAILLAAEIDRLDVERSAKFVNSNEITVDFWIGAMRTEGARVQKVTTTV